VDSITKLAEDSSSKKKLAPNSTKKSEATSNTKLENSSNKKIKKLQLEAKTKPTPGQAQSNLPGQPDADKSKPDDLYKDKMLPVKDVNNVAIEKLKAEAEECQGSGMPLKLGRSGIKKSVGVNPIEALKTPDQIKTPHQSKSPRKSKTPKNNKKESMQEQN
jgi:hypothetical protein